MDVDASMEMIEEDTPEVAEGVQQKEKTPEKQKFVRLPLARVKNIMKMDPDCKMISQDAVYLVTKSTEMFIEMLSKKTVEFTIGTKRKTVMKRDLENAIGETANLCFLDGMLDAAVV